ncbi:MAG: Tetrathionate reductase subunit B precursor [Candidatus Heimdallarchaeota archaeon LC_2]|nr:MAG: Tetrathionate reductase subunit B precursor [Candidatus Heimdallarchaeota archaeon LC_2]
MKINRRNFLKGVVGAGGTLAMSSALISLKVYSDDMKSHRPYENWQKDNTEWMMIIDLAKCDGCTEEEIALCTKSCIDGHYTPDDVEYIKIFELEDSEFTKKSFFPRPCQQCRDPPCVHICPVGAAWQRDGDRLTLIDHSRCIGCRLCMAACPYDARLFMFENNPKADQIPEGAIEDEMPFSLLKYKGVTSKCEFCGLQFIGLLPHCVSACHTGALYFGNIKENAVTNGLGETRKIDELIRERGGFRWKEEEGTMPRVYYLPETGIDGGI